MSGWIPKVYYDFLARIVPGSVVVLGSLYLQEGPVRGVSYFLRTLCEVEESFWCRFAIGLLVAYLTGLILGEVGELLAGRLLRRRDDELEAGFARECLDEHNRSLAASGQTTLDVIPDDLPDMTVMAEQFTLADHYGGSRLLALKAERRMCMVLAFGLFLLALGNLLAFTADFAVKRLIVEGLLVLGMLVVWRRSGRLHERTVRQTCLGWLMRIPTGGASGSAS
jgi:lysylphosphatidylglycerol synthetase-like protein (DUF2156 family)